MKSDGSIKFKWDLSVQINKAIRKPKKTCVYAFAHSNVLCLHRENNRKTCIYEWSICHNSYQNLKYECVLSIVSKNLMLFEKNSIWHELTLMRILYKICKHSFHRLQSSLQFLYYIKFWCGINKKKLNFYRTTLSNR